MKVDVRKIIIIAIIAICALALAYGIYFQVFVKNKEEHIGKNTIVESPIGETVEFDGLFDNKINYQGYNLSNEIKIDQTKELVYTNYTQTEIYEGKYTMKVNIPIININNENIAKINEEIDAIFQDKVDSVMENRSNENAPYTIYNVDYTAYINENILSLVIRATLKEGDNAQRLIIKSYTYNISTNEQIPLSNMLDIRGKDKIEVEKQIKRTVQEEISQADNLAALGYDVYERDINSQIYTVENSNNYFLGPNGTIYIIYAYGNSNFTSEKDVVEIN